MKLMSTYAVKISRSADIRSILSATAGIYRKAVDFFIEVYDREWDVISPRKMQTEKVNAIESFTVKTSKRPVVPYDFGKDFYKFPCYLRRAAISEAIGKVSSYRSNLKNWEAADPHGRGRRPGYPKAGYIYPAMYRDNMFVRTGTYIASIKVFTRSTWDWLDISLCKGDVDYILHHCGSRKECVPTHEKPLDGGERKTDAFELPRRRRRRPGKVVAKISGRERISPKKFARGPRQQQ